MKLVLPMAGYGARLRPHTWSKPKPLISVAGKPVLAHFLDSLPRLAQFDEAIFIVGYLGDQVKQYVSKHYPQLNARYVVQPELSGQSHAIWLAREGLQGPALLGFVDTWIETDFSGLDAEGVIWVKEVEDPRRFGLVELGQDGWVRRLIEKPQDPQSNLAVVGFYYFPEVANLLEAIERQMASGTTLKGEYFLADAINLLLQAGVRVRAQPVQVWQDFGTPSAILEANRYLLDHGRDNSQDVPLEKGVRIEPPAYVDPTASIHESVIGPHASIGPGCRIERSQIRNSIVEADTNITGSTLTASLIGQAARVADFVGSLNIGDSSDVRGTAEKAQ
ncbi:MAG: sugar phosphate nucleotidyltransferase [Anaerolineales bacterium]